MPRRQRTVVIGPVPAICVLASMLFALAAVGVLIATLDHGTPMERQHRGSVAAAIMGILSAAACCGACLLGIARDPGNSGRRPVTATEPLFERRAKIVLV